MMPQQSTGSKTIRVCIHCGDNCGKDYCQKCSTLEKRIAVDEANAKNFKEHGQSYASPCAKCKRELEQIEAKKKK